MSLTKRIAPALAAVLVAAAFVVSCLCAPVAYCSETTTAIDEQFSLASSALSGDSSSFSFIALHSPSYELFFVADKADRSNSSTFTLYGVSRIVYNDGSVLQSPSSANLVVYSNAVDFASDTFWFDSSKSWYILAFCIAPEVAGKLSNPTATYQAIYSGSGSSGAGIAFTTPTVSSPLSASDYYSTHVSSRVVRRDNDAVTTTTTTTTTTTSTTTTTAATLPPYPYETSPPFTLPDDWTADYSETTPVPDVDYQPPTVDFQPAEIPSEVMSGVGFWFTIFTDFWQQFNLTWVVLLVVGLGFLVYLLWG